MTTCPNCGGQLQTETNVTVSEPYVKTGFVRRDRPTPRRFRVAPVVYFCNSCEFVGE